MIDLVSSRYIRLIIFFMSLFLWLACEQSDDEEIPSADFVIQEEIQIPVVGENKYVGFDGAAGEILIKNEEGLFLFDLARRSVRWKRPMSEMTYLDDVAQTFHLLDDYVVVVGLNHLQKFNRSDGSLYQVQKIPTRYPEFEHFPAYNVSIDDKPYFLLQFTPIRPPNEEVVWQNLTNEDYFKRRQYGLLPLSDSDSIGVTSIGKIAPDANIVSDEDKIPLHGTKYLVLEDTLYYAFNSEPKVWQIPVSLDDPDAIRTFNLALKFPAINYRIPKSQANNIHSIEGRMDGNILIQGLLYDSKTDLIYLPYARALFDYERDMIANKPTSMSRLELGIQRFNLAVMDRTFTTIKEAIIPNTHTVIGVHNGYIYVKGWDEGENYDIVYKGKIE